MIRMIPSTLPQRNSRNSRKHPHPCHLPHRASGGRRGTVECVAIALCATLTLAAIGSEPEGGANGTNTSTGTGTGNVAAGEAAPQPPAGVLERILKLRAEHQNIVREIAAENDAAKRESKLQSAADLQQELQKLETQLGNMIPQSTSGVLPGATGSGPGVTTPKPLHPLGEPDPDLTLTRPLDGSRPAFSLDTPMTDPSQSPRLQDMGPLPSVNLADPSSPESVTLPLDKNLQPTVSLDGGPVLDDATLNSVTPAGPGVAEPVSRETARPGGSQAPSIPAAVNSGTVPEVNP